MCLFRVRSSWSHHDDLCCRSSRYSAASGWSASERIGETGESAADLDIAVDKAGNALALWLSFNGSTVPGRIMANRYIAGRGCGWSTAAPIDTNNGNAVYHPRLAIDGDGNAVAVWSRSEDTAQSVEANRFEWRAPLCCHYLHAGCA